MAKKLRFLEENSFITRTIDSKDKRVFRFTITTKWAQAMDTISPIYENAISQIFEDIDDRDIAIGWILIQKCLQNFDKHCPLK